MRKKLRFVASWFLIVLAVGVLCFPTLLTAILLTPPAFAEGGEAGSDGAEVSRNNLLSFAPGTAITWNDEIRDDGGLWNNVVPTRFNIHNDGWYVVSASILISCTTSDSYCQAYIMKNGSEGLAYNVVYREVAGYWSSSVSIVTWLEDGDYVEVYGNWDGGGNRTMHTSSRFTIALVPRITGYRVAANSNGYEELTTTWTAYNWLPGMAGIKEGTYLVTLSTNLAVGQGTEQAFAGFWAAECGFSKVQQSGWIELLASPDSGEWVATTSSYTWALTVPDGECWAFEFRFKEGNGAGEAYVAKSAQTAWSIIEVTTLKDGTTECSY